MKKQKRTYIWLLVLALLAALILFGGGDRENAAAPSATPGLSLVTAAPDSGTPTVPPSGADTEPTAQTPPPAEEELAEDGVYTTAEDVARYLIAYGHLPSNFITKNEARKAGWDGGSLERYCPGMCIGGDRFGNREGLLPNAKGRIWYECDINTLYARSRGAERLVYSNDGLIYYSGDHYESFQLLYGDG